MECCLGNVGKKRQSYSPFAQRFWGIWIKILFRLKSKSNFHAGPARAFTVQPNSNTISGAFVKLWAVRLGFAASESTTFKRRLHHDTRMSRPSLLLRCSFRSFRSAACVGERTRTQRSTHSRRCIFRSDLGSVRQAKAEGSTEFRAQRVCAATRRVTTFNSANDAIRNVT